MKRLTVIQDMLCYALFYVLDLCTLYKKQAERGCFFNRDTDFSRDIFSLADGLKEVSKSK